MTQNGLPTSPQPDLTVPSLSRRMACWLYEGMLLFGVMVASGLVYFVAAYWLTGLSPGDMNIHPQLIVTAPFHLPPIEVGVLTMGWVVVWGLLSKFHPEKQFLHDAIAKTRLISTR